MKLRFVPSVLIFLSAYSPLSIMFLIQDFDFVRKEIVHPGIVWPLLGLSALSCLFLYAAVCGHKSSSPPVTVRSVSNRSRDLLSYSVPYMMSFFAVDLGDVKTVASFAFFMLVMYCLSVKTSSMFINPMLAIMGYRLCKIRYERNGHPCEDFVLAKGPRLRKNGRCRITEIADQLYVVTEWCPEG